MARMIVVRTASGYRGARLEYDKEDILDTLKDHWSGTMAIHGLVAGGDMLTLRESGAMRVSNRMITRSAETLIEMVKKCQAEKVHHVSIYDESNKTSMEFAEWNMTCEAGDDLFLENIRMAGPWYHLIDGREVEHLYNQQKAA